MRYPPEETAAKHQRVLSLAAAMIRERGIDAVSVSELMKGAGLTHGSFYSHFASKDDLASAALQEAMNQKAALLAQALADPASAKQKFVEQYLSATHRDERGDGCPMAALAVEVGRRGKDRSLLGGYLKGLLDRLTGGFRWGKRGSERDQAILLMSAMLGAVILARAVDDEALSDEILAATQRQLLGDGHPPPLGATVVVSSPAGGGPSGGSTPVL